LSKNLDGGVVLWLTRCVSSTLFPYLCKIRSEPLFGDAGLRFLSSKPDTNLHCMHTELMRRMLCLFMPQRLLVLFFASPHGGMARLSLPEWLRSEIFNLSADCDPSTVRLGPYSTGSCLW